MDQAELFAFLERLPTPVVAFDRESPERIVYANPASEKSWSCFYSSLGKRGREAIDNLGRGREQVDCFGRTREDAITNIRLEMDPGNESTTWRITRTAALILITLADPTIQPPRVKTNLTPFFSPRTVSLPSHAIPLPNVDLIVINEPPPVVSHFTVPSWLLSTPVGLFRTDSDYSLRWCNVYFRKEIGLSYHEHADAAIVPLPTEEELGERIFPDDLEAVTAFRERLLTTQTEQEIEFRWNTSSETQSKWGYVKVVPEMKDGVCAGFNGVISSRTISLLKLSAQKSQEDQQQLESLALLSEFSAVGLATISLAGHVLTVNDSWRRIVQLQGAEEPKDWIHRVIDSEVEDVVAHWRSSMSTQSPFIRTIRTKAGIVCFVQTVINTQRTGYIGSVTDITVQWNTEQRLIALSGETEARVIEALKQKRELEMLVDFVSHEIRTPTSCILQGAELTRSFLVDLKQELKSPLSPSTIDDIDEAIDTQDGLIDCALSQTRIANDILGLAAISLNRYEISATAVDIVACAQKLLQGFKNQCKLAFITLKLDIGASLAALGEQRVMVDPVRLGQIVINLVSNAIRFTTERKIRVVTLAVDVASPSAPATHSSPRQTEHFRPSAPISIHLSVSDTGVGMSEEEKTKLFQYCSQSSPLTHLRFGGSGLGLWIVKQLVELMNGEVKVESTLDVGTTFSCFVAGTIVDADGEVPFPLEITAESDGVPLVVLVCEDNPMSQRLLKRQLERAGHHVDTANDGLAGLEAISQRVYDCVIMDVEVPLCDGLEATRRIRSEEARANSGSSLRVIGLTGNARASQIEQALASGMTVVTTKPYKISSLLSQLR